MTVKVKQLKDAFPDGSHTTPHARACALGYAGADYLRACVLAIDNHKQIGPLFNFMLPTMHQTLELLSKAVAFMVDQSFDPKKYSHRVFKLLADYSSSTPVFEKILTDQKAVVLLQELEKSYMGVRYGECYIEYDYEDWQLFVLCAGELLNDLHVRTNLRFF
jgi:hypothetical protein